MRADAGVCEHNDESIKCVVLFTVKKVDSDVFKIFFSSDQNFVLA